MIKKVWVILLERSLSLHKIEICSLYFIKMLRSIK